MGQFERDVKRAFDTFLADITSAAERAAIEGIHAGFVRASTQASHAVAATADDVPPSDELAHRRARAPIDRAAMRERVVACIRENPGWDTVQLGRSLGIYPSKLRRQLRELANDGAIRFEEQPLGFGGQRRRMYFVGDPANGAHAEPSAVPCEPPAIPVEAMA